MTVLGPYTEGIYYGDIRRVSDRLSWSQKFGPPISERDPFWKFTPEIEAPRLRLV
jgi:hypothetical protein